MSIFLFADESGTSASEPCYSIGALLVPETLLDEFNREFSRFVDVHGVVGEVRWKKVAKSHGLMNLLSICFATSSHRVFVSIASWF